MGLGNRRFVVLAAAAISVALALSGCSASSNEESLAAVSVGQQAVGFTSSGSSSGSSSGTTGWRSVEPCSPSLQSGIESGVTAGVTLTLVDPGSVSGPERDPNLNTGDVATCAFRATSGGGTQVQEFFLGMPQSYFTEYATKLTDDGFTAGAVVVPKSGVGSEQIFEKDSGRVVLLYNPTAPGLVAIFG